MADNEKDFKINIETTASGDGAAKTEEALKGIAEATEEVTKKQADAAEVAGKAAAASTGVGLAVLAVGQALEFGIDVWREWSREAEKAAKESEDALKRIKEEADKTAEAMRKLTQASEDFDAAQNNAVARWDRIADAAERAEKKIQGAIDRQREMWDAESDTEKARIDAAEKRGDITHKDAAEQRASVDAEKRKDKYSAEEAKAYEKERALVQENKRLHDEARDIARKAAAAGDRGAASVRRGELEGVDDRAIAKQDAAREEMKRLRTEGVAPPVGALPEQIRAHQALLEEQSRLFQAANEEHKKAVKEIEDINSKYDDLGNQVDESKRAEKARQDAIRAGEKIAKEVADNSAAISESQKDRINHAAVAAEKEKAEAIKAKSAIDEADKRDTTDAARKTRDDNKPQAKAIADAERKVHQSESDGKKTADSLSKLLSALEKNKGFKDSAFDQQIQQLIAQLKVDPGNASALKQLSAALQQLSSTRNQEAAGTVALMQQMLAAEKAHVAETAKLKAELEALKSQISTL